jgi:hypothetical protein
MAAAAAMIDKIGSSHLISYIKNGKYSDSDRSVLRSENFWVQQQAGREVPRLQVSRPDSQVAVWNLICGLV